MTKSLDEIREEILQEIEEAKVVHKSLELERYAKGQLIAFDLCREVMEEENQALREVLELAAGKLKPTSVSNGKTVKQTCAEVLAKYPPKGSAK